MAVAVAAVAEAARLLFFFPAIVLFRSRLHDSKQLTTKCALNRFGYFSLFLLFSLFSFLFYFGVFWGVLFCLLHSFLQNRREGDGARQVFRFCLVFNCSDLERAHSSTAGLFCLFLNDATVGHNATGLSWSIYHNNGNSRFPVENTVDHGNGKKGKKGNRMKWPPSHSIIVWKSTNKATK